jgi:FkbM family methyltransferase
MAVLKRLSSAVHGTFWLVRGAGLRSRVHGLEKQVRQLNARLGEAAEQMAQLNARLLEANDQAAAHVQQLNARLLEANQQLAVLGAGVEQAIRRSDATLDYLKSSVDVLGHKMFLDSKDTLLLAGHGVYEPFETGLLQQQIGPGDVVVDVGAHIGYYTLLFARRVGPQGRVFAFEPDPANFDLLQRNVERNGYTNVTLVRRAVAAQSGKLRLYLCEDNKGDHRTYDSHDGRLSLEIDAVSLDDYFAGSRDPISLIKMDIQGAEEGALRGMVQVLGDNPCVKVATEFWPIGLQRSGTSAQAFLDYLREQGFQLYHIDEAGRTLVPADIPHLLRTYVPEKENYTNLLCARQPLKLLAA